MRDSELRELIERIIEKGGELIMITDRPARKPRPLQEKFLKENVIPAFAYTTDSGNWHLLARKKTIGKGVFIVGEVFERVPQKIHFWRRKHAWQYDPESATIFWQTGLNPPNYIRQIALELSQYLKGESCQE